MSDDEYNDAKYDMDIYFEEITEYKHHLLRRYLAQSSAFVMLWYYEKSENLMKA